MRLLTKPFKVGLDAIHTPRTHAKPSVAAGLRPAWGVPRRYPNHDTSYEARHPNLQTTTHRVALRPASPAIVPPLERPPAGPAGRPRRSRSGDQWTQQRQPRSSPLMYFQFEGSADLIVVASNYGLDHHPAWYLNAAADPNVSVETMGETFPATARITHGDERAALFDKVAAANPRFARYRAATHRQIPVVALHRKA